MSELGEAIAAARAHLELLMKSCPHVSKRPVCKHPDSAMACDDCGKVIGDGILSYTAYGDKP